MRVLFSWLKEFAPVAASATEVAQALIRLGFEVEGVERLGEGVRGPLVVGTVAHIEELTEFKKPIRFCQVDVGAAHGGVRGIVCGARNFAEGDRVVVALPGSELPGGFTITARETYGRVSDGMICSERELGLSDEHSGILVLDPDCEVGADASAVLGLGDAVLDVSVNPDRGYAMSVRGLAREVASAFSVAFVDPADDLPALPEPTAGSVPRPIAVDSPACSIFVLRTLHDVDAGAPTPRWLSQRLRAAGVRPVSLIVDVTNYVMLELGQPLHAFDAERVAGAVVVRRARPGEALELLDHTTRELTEDDVVIADDSGALSLAGIMGGVQSEISSATTSVLIEAAHFDHRVIAASCRRHRLSTDASRRFERGVDPRLAPVAAHRAASLLVALAGAHSAGLQAVEFEQPAIHVSTTAQAISALIGLPVDTDACARLLRAVGCDVDANDDALVVTPPTWRPDLRLGCDLAEEVARLIGYDQIPALKPSPTDHSGLRASQRARRNRDNSLVGFGWTQVMLTPFTSKDAVAALGCAETDERMDLVPLLNPMSDEEPFLRSTLIPSLAAAVRRNRSRGFDSVAVFEASAAHRNGSRAATAAFPAASAPPTPEQFAQMLAAAPVEQRWVAGIACGAWREASWDGPRQAWQWQHAVRAACAVLEAYGLNPHVSAGERAGWHPGRCAALTVDGPDGTVVGWAGEMHPRTLERLDLPPRTVAFEVRVDALEARMDSAMPPAFSRTVATSPVVKEDVALVVGADVPSAALAQALREGCGSLLESVHLFDEYTGEQVGQGRKSLAFSLRFRHPERSLTDDEVAAARTAGVEVAAARHGAKLRAAATDSAR